MTKEKLFVTTCLLLLVAISIPYLASCGGSDSAQTPEVVDCDTIRFDGETYNFGFAAGCAPGVVSFQSTITQNGKTVCFNVTCSNGCIQTATECSNGTTAPMAP